MIFYNIKHKEIEGMIRIIIKTEAKVISKNFVECIHLNCLTNKLS